MNVYEAISNYLTNSMYNVDGYDSRVVLADFVAQYDALAPDWSNAPDDAVCYAIDANGEANWYDHDVDVSQNASFWGVLMDRGSDAGFVNIRDGIDWKCCKWQRPEVK